MLLCTLLTILIIREDGFDCEERQSVFFHLDAIHGMVKLEHDKRALYELWNRERI
jgi:hypothetical protein